MLLTPEQQQVVEHPTGRHGRVLSVAGSGKTTTMAHRVKHLTIDLKVPPQNICILMFNRFAREEFARKLDEIGLPKEFQPRVNTFHSYAYGIWQSSKTTTANKEWLGEHEEWQAINLRRTYDTVVNTLPEREQDNVPELEECERAIGLWKSKLILPHNAGYNSPHEVFVTKVYTEYERRRHRENAHTYDDFVPMAVAQLEAIDPERRPPLRHIIVDEYQDINLGQQRLLELLAENGADMMVVGDDDQTIYEWRGARPEFIINEFQSIFDNKPHTTYKLTQSFRFGYQIAQAADNVIWHNPNRTAKNTIAHDLSKEAAVSVITQNEEESDSNRLLAQEVMTLVTRQEVNPGQIRVMARTYAQLNPLATEFLIDQIPFRTIGQKPLFETTEVQTLLDYIAAAAGLFHSFTEELENQVLNIANRPNRFLSRRALRQQISKAKRQRKTLSHALTPPDNDEDPLPGEDPLSQHNSEAMLGLLKSLESISQVLGEDNGNPNAGRLLEKADDSAALSQHYQDFYGPGERANNRISNLVQAKRYAAATGLTWHEFHGHIKNLDTTLGLPENEVIVCSTIHRVKGLEFDYVIIPDCREGTMPVIAKDSDRTCDKTKPNQDISASEWIEAERRLFYVAMTRARKAVYIGTPPLPKDLSLLLKMFPNPPQVGNKSSRFLEELELNVLYQADEALAQATAGDPSLLTKLGNDHSGHHRVINLIKNEYSHQLPPETQRAISYLKTSRAERAFGYLQTYDSPDSKQQNIGSEPIQRPIWSHLAR